jgi:transposase
VARPYSDDLPARVAAAIVGEQTCWAAAALFDISVSAVAKWSALVRAEGSADTKPVGGARRAVLASQQACRSKSTASTHAGPGASCISARTPTPAKSSQQG